MRLKVSPTKFLETIKIQNYYLIVLNLNLQFNKKLSEYFPLLLRQSKLRKSSIKQENPTKAELENIKDSIRRQNNQKYIFSYT